MERPIVAERPKDEQLLPTNLIAAFKQAEISLEPDFLIDDQPEVRITGWLDERDGYITCFWRKEDSSAETQEWLVVCCNQPDIQGLSAQEVQEYLIDLPASQLNMGEKNAAGDDILTAVASLVLARAKSSSDKSAKPVKTQEVRKAGDRRRSLQEQIGRQLHELHERSA